MSIKNLLNANTKYSLDAKVHDIAIAGDETVSGNSTLTGNLSVGGTLGVTGLSTLANTTITGTHNVSGLSTFTNTTKIENSDGQRYLDIDRTLATYQAMIRLRSINVVKGFIGLNASSDHIDFHNGIGNLMGQISTSTAIKDNTIGGAIMYVSTGGQLGVASSLLAHKGNLKLLNGEAENIYKMNVYKYQRKKIKDGKVYDELEPRIYYGFIADELEKIDKNYCVYFPGKDNKLELRDVNYNSILASLVKCVQDLNDKVTELEKK
jgi:hypothetical protein